MDPLSIIAGSTGTVAFALQVAYTLYDLVNNIDHAPSEVATIAGDAEALSKILSTLEGWLDMGVIRPEAAQSLTAPLNACVTAMSKLQMTIRPYIKITSNNSYSWRASIAWTFKRSEVKELRDCLAQGKLTLSVSIGIINT